MLNGLYVYWIYTIKTFGKAGLNKGPTGDQENAGSTLPGRQHSFVEI